MANRKTVFSIDEFYHLYNRGNGKNIIFKDSEDYDRFVDILFLSNSTESFNVSHIKSRKLTLSQIENKGKKLVSIGSFVLMPNHYHILVREVSDKGISKFMKKVGTAYASYFNKKYDRSGTLFEGKFKSTHVVKDEHLKYLFAYFYMNPLKLIDKDWKSNARFNKKTYLKFLKDYKYSSFYFLENKKDVSKIIDTKISSLLNIDNFPDYFSEEGRSFEEYIFEWLSIYIEEEMV